MTGRRVMLVAGEASGDMHGAALVRAMRCRAPDIAVCGMGGPELAAAGMERLVDASRLAVVGILEVLGHLAAIRRAMRLLTARLRQGDVGLLILIDFPDFNLSLARRAKTLGIPVFYYISPQVWAWRAGRVEVIRGLVDRMAVILPFEEEFYRRRGMEVVDVGHPLVERVAAGVPAADWRRAQGIGAGVFVVGLLPGSRMKEIRALLPCFLATARRLVVDGAAAGRRYVFVLPVAPTVTDVDLAAGGLRDAAGLEILVLRQGRYDAMAACDAVLAASGTVTLELALLDVPMVVAYRVAALTYHLIKRLAKVRFITLVNLVADREVVPEFIQHDAEPAGMAAALARLLHDADARRETRQGLREVRQGLGGPGASERAAAIALELLGL